MTGATKVANDQQQGEDEGAACWRIVPPRKGVQLQRAVDLSCRLAARMAPPRSPAGTPSHPSRCLLTPDAGSSGRWHHGRTLNRS